MSVLTQVECKSWKGIVFQSLVIIVLLVGGVTMVYPFVLMISGAMRSEMDSADLDAIPKFLVDETTLARKFLETKYNHNISIMNRSHGGMDFSFAQATVPSALVIRRISDLQAFIEQADLPAHWSYLGGTNSYKMILPPNLERLIDRLRDRYGGDLRTLSRDRGLTVEQWRDIAFALPQWPDPRFSYQPSRYWDAYFELAEQRPFAEKGLVSIRGWFMENVVFPRYGRASTEAYNAAHTFKISNYQEFHLPRRSPGTNEPTLRSEWLKFVTEILNSAFVRTDVNLSAYQDHLARKYSSIEVLNQRWKTHAYTNFKQIRMPDDRDWIPAAHRQDFQEFLGTVAPESLYLVGPKFAWADWLAENYSTISELNAAHKTSATAWSHVPLPVAESELAHVRANTRILRWEFATRNFRNIFGEILLQGRPLINTLIYVALSLVLALTLQPLAAYALSRFEPPGTWRFILIFMATMAFPPMVGMIPQFLMLREAMLLNSFVALVLPIMVNGFLIFLLKGFFDSLPGHLYEAALIDGASEFRMFWEITMSLSKPILAVVALQTFNFAWMSFMYPLLVCPDPDMQVLAVWLYDFQQSAGTPAVFASIIVTSIPTLLIFIFAQRTIMRGIAVPAEK